MWPSPPCRGIWFYRDQTLSDSPPRRGVYFQHCGKILHTFWRCVFGLYLSSTSTNGESIGTVFSAIIRDINHTNFNFDLATTTLWESVPVSPSLILCSLIFYACNGDIAWSKFGIGGRILACKHTDLKDKIIIKITRI